MAAISLAARTKSPPMKTDSATPPSLFSVVWNDSPGVSEKQLRLRQSRQAVRPDAVQGVPDGALEMLVERRLGARLVVVRDRLVEDRGVPRFLEVCGHAKDQPGRVVVEAAADVVVAALGQRLVLVISAAARQLGGGDVEDSLAGARGNHVDESEEILVRVAEAHAPADARLEAGRGARHVERHHALVGVPDVDHPVHVLAAGTDLEDAQHLRPVVAQVCERLLHGGRLQVAGDDRLDPLLVDRLRVGRIELVVLGVLLVAEQDDHFLRLAGRKVQLDVMGAHRLPPVGDRIGGLAGLHHDRPVPAAVGAEEAVALGVEAGQGDRAGEEREVVAPLPVLRLVIDDAVLDLDLAGGVVALEVGVVFQCFP
jgi:hypothetical protein